MVISIKSRINLWSKIGLILGIEFLMQWQVGMKDVSLIGAMGLGFYSVLE